MKTVPPLNLNQSVIQSVIMGRLRRREEDGQKRREAFHVVILRWMDTISATFSMHGFNWIARVQDVKWKLLVLLVTSCIFGGTVCLLYTSPSPRD